MKIEIDVSDIQLFAKALNNAIASYGDIAFGIMFGCEIPSKLESLRQIPFRELENRIHCLKEVYKQIEELETKMKC